MSTTILEKAFGALTRIDVKTQMSSHGSSKAMNIFLVVNDNEAKDCVEALHSEFVQKDFVSEVQGADSEHNGSLIPVSSSAIASSGGKRKPDEEHGTRCTDTGTDTDTDTDTGDDRMELDDFFDNFHSEELRLTAEEEGRSYYIKPDDYYQLVGARASSSLKQRSSALRPAYTNLKWKWGVAHRRQRPRKANPKYLSLNSTNPKYLSLNSINARNRPPVA